MTATRGMARPSRPRNRRALTAAQGNTRPKVKEVSVILI